MSNRRITINLDPRSDKAISQLMEVTGKNTTEVVQMSTKLCARLVGAIEKGATVQLKRPDGSTVEVIVVY
ncbi:MAG TPA: hypothetical protein VFT87_01710 [Candidatus Saccharimonadales bacterium]|nr:hypothetical protein [Candidatus Saccharimonadales bacterium]